MRSKLFIGVSAVLALLCVLAGAVYAYDLGHRDHIAKGVRVAGIDVCGLTRDAAQRKLEGRLLGALHEPIVVRHGARRFTLGPRQAHVAADISGMVDEAVTRSRAGNIFTRTIRGLTGGRIHEDLTPRITYSKAAVTRLIHRVRAAVGRPAVDATLSFHPGGFSKVDGSAGLQVKAHRLRARIAAAIVNPSARRTFVAHTRRTAPKVTSADLARTYATLLIIDRANFQLRLYTRLQLTKSYDIAVGMIGLETPAGLYHIQNKAINPAWSVPHSSWTGSLAGKVIPGGTPENPLKSRWLGIFNGAGIHGIDPSEYGTIGHAASHGCVRMRIADVEDLYPRVPVGAPVYIA